MSNQEPTDSHETTFGVDPAVEGSDRTTVHTYRYDREGNVVSHEVSFPDSIPRETLDRLRELASQFRVDHSMRPPDTHRQMSAGYGVLPFGYPVVREVTEYHFSDAQIERSRQWENMQRQVRDRMVQDSQLPPDVLFDDSDDRLRARMHRFNLYEGISVRRQPESSPVCDEFAQVSIPQYAVGELPQNWQREERSQPIACQGCQHYHGVTYGSKAKGNGDRLVCAMHPSGPGSETCADREEMSWEQMLLSEDWAVTHWEKLNFGDRQLWLDRLDGFIAISRESFSRSLSVHTQIGRIIAGMTRANSATRYEMVERVKPPEASN